MQVYLCGTMTQDEKHTKWREEATAAFAIYGIGTLSPMRKEKLQDAAGLTGCHDARVSVARDMKDLREADAVLVNVLGIETIGRQSIGTWCEVATAYHLGLPIVIIADHFSVVGHPFILAWATKVVGTLSEAIDVISWLD